MTAELPHHPPAATLVAVYPRWTLRLQRTFPQDRAAVWSAITDPEQVARWTPFRPDRNLGSPGPVRIVHLDGSDQVFDSEVRDEIPQESITFLWGNDQLRFGLTDVENGTSLTLAQTFDNRNAAPAMAAGWHLRLAALEVLLAGGEIPSVVGPNARQHGFEDLERAYEEIFAERDAAMSHDEENEGEDDDSVGS